MCFPSRPYHCPVTQLCYIIFLGLPHFSVDCALQLSQIGLELVPKPVLNVDGYEHTFLPLYCPYRLAFVRPTADIIGTVHLTHTRSILATSSASTRIFALTVPARGVPFLRPLQVRLPIHLSNHFFHFSSP
jgi:hypothetical protein